MERERRGNEGATELPHVLRRAIVGTVSRVILTVTRCHR
jgi:hypothetical protein